MLPIKLLVLITHVLMCTASLTRLLFVSSLQHLEFVHAVSNISRECFLSLVKVHKRFFIENQLADVNSFLS